MRVFLLVALLLLVGCFQESAIATRLDDRTFRIEGPPVPGGAETPNRRAAELKCPRGYRVLESQTQKGGRDRVIDEPNPMTIWTIRCF